MSAGRETIIALPGRQAAPTARTAALPKARPDRDRRAAPLTATAVRRRADRAAWTGSLSLGFREVDRAARTRTFDVGRLSISAELTRSTSIIRTSWCRPERADAQAARKRWRRAPTSGWLRPAAMSRAVVELMPVAGARAGSLSYGHARRSQAVIQPATGHQEEQAPSRDLRRALPGDMPPDHGPVVVVTYRRQR